MGKQVTLQLTPEEVATLNDALRDSLSYISCLDDRDNHPGDLVDWGKTLQVTGSILLKLKEASHVESKKKTK